MNRYLLDVNAFLALLDPMHVHHAAIHAWYGGLDTPVILVCSHVVNGVLRIASQPKYPNSLGTTSKVREVLQQFISRVPHEFCTKEANLLDDAVLVQKGLLTPGRVSDLYLLALAIAHGAKFATLDHKIPGPAVAGGAAGMELIPLGP